MSDEAPSYNNKQLTPEERYEQDPAFKSLVIAFQLVIHKTCFTQEEMREAITSDTQKRFVGTITQRFFIPPNSFVH
jgi:hypothetical protein